LHKVSLDDQGKFLLPSALCQRYGLEAGEELFLEETETGLVLHPLRTDVRKVYLEVTTRCNLHCHTCVRNVWTEPLEDMVPATFERVIAQLHDLPQLQEVVFGGYGEPFAHPCIQDETPSFPPSSGWAVRRGDWLLWGLMELPRMNWGAERRCRFVTSGALVVGWDGTASTFPRVWTATCARHATLPRLTKAVGVGAPRVPTACGRRTSSAVRRIAGE